LLEGLTDEQVAELLFDWHFWARPEQVAPPGDWQTWLILTGRGWGKSMTGSEWIRERVEKHGSRRLALLGATAADVRDTMIEGPSGLLACCPPGNRPQYEPSKRRVTWRNGAVAIAYSADEPNRLRGPQHDSAWCDELCTFRYVESAWDNLMFGLRMGRNPQVVITTTPRPLKLLRELMAEAGTVITRGSLYENIGNLASTFVQKIVRRYEGTRLGRQEIDGELLEDVPGALWTRAMVEAARFPLDPHKGIKEQVPALKRIVVAVDPAVTSGDDADDTGIMVGGLGVDGNGYLLADNTCHESPDAWARRAVKNYRDHGADRIVAEVNNGGDLVESMIRTVDPRVPYKSVHASRGKRVRAEPISGLYEQKRIKHIGSFPELEDQMCNFVPDVTEKSPDRVDALVWLFTELMITEDPPRLRTAQGPAL
jgi:phage terminase large subunit-like protein